MSPSPASDRGAALDIYSHGRAAVREVLHDTRLLAGQAPLAALLTSSAKTRNSLGYAFSPVVAADAAFLLAHAADPMVGHALDGRLPQILADLDSASAARREEVIAAAQRAADPGRALTGADPSPATRTGVPGRSDSWLHDNELRERLGSAVRAGLQSAEQRFTGQDRPGAAWTPATRPIWDAVTGVSATATRGAGLTPGWSTFVEIQMIHAIARANDLPSAAGPLDDRIPARIRQLPTFGVVAQADILHNAHHYLTPHSLPTTAPRMQAATIRTGPPAAPARALPATTTVPPQPARKSR
ncbi:hypothetical protein ACFVUH_08275 [Kitasatospora sp. NPDC058032]|uniref:hypothetical protein n=1 Tax=Kitasatospora sp. NPDC058032 TaxID=3346307 RepID=UPI0036DC2E8C